MREINFHILSHSGHASVERISKIILCQVIWRIEPFFLQLSPEAFRYIQMRGIRRQEEQVQSPFLPIGDSFPYDFGLMDACVIQYNKCFTPDAKGKSFQEIQDNSGFDIIPCDLPDVVVLPVNEPQTVELVGFFAQEANILPGKLPAVRDIAFAAHMRLIPIIKIDAAFGTQRFEFPQLFYLKMVVFLHWLAFRATPYLFISSAKVFKKALKVVSPTFFPLSASHCALAMRMRCRLALMAARMESLSSTIERTGFLPRPDLVCKPDMPSLLYRLTQLFTLMAHMPVTVPTSLDLNPSALRRMLWQRIRKQWLGSSLNPCSNSLRCSDVSIGLFTRPIISAKIINNLN